MHNTTARTNVIAFSQSSSMSAKDFLQIKFTSSLQLLYLTAKRRR